MLMFFVCRDDVPEEVKQKRLAELIQVFRQYMMQKTQEEVGKVHLILIDGVRICSVL